MAVTQLGNIQGFAARGGKGINGGDDGATAYFNANSGTLAAKRARLTAINGTYYTTTRLDQLTHNDIDYALRLADNPTSI